MLPTPDRIRATRRWAATEAALAAVILAPLPWLGLSGWTAIAASAVVAIAVFAFVAARGMRPIRRRRRALARPFPAGIERELHERVAFYRALDVPTRARFRELGAIILDETPIIGVACEIDDTVRALVVASAVIPILAFPAWEYAGLRKVLVRPEPFDPEFHAQAGATPNALGMVGVSGCLNGVMILSRPDLIDGFALADGANVGIHEFAHLVDAGDGSIDGVPATMPRACVRPWAALVRSELERHRSRAGLSSYALTNEAEYFAVASEAFFERPDDLQRRMPELYDLLERTFRQDPLTRLRRRSPF